MQKNVNKQLGFTIIEIALVLIVAGSMLAFLGSALLDFQKKKRVDLTEYRLEKIRVGLDKYLTEKGRLPCPASFLAAPGTGAFGREVTDTTFGTGGDCTGTAAGNRTTGNIAGTILVDGARIVAPDSLLNRVRIGSVPVRDLDLTDETMVDGWGNRFTYAVTINQATVDITAAPPIRYAPDGGAIDIVGLGGSILPTLGTAHYAVISHGEDQMGANNIMGVAPLVSIPCVDVAANIQRENCVNDVNTAATFLETMHRDDGNYDDFIAYSAESSKNDDIPTGAIVPFNLQHCPLGWSVFEKARGRLIMGIVDADTIDPTDDNVMRTSYDPFSVAATPVTSDMDYPVGQTDATDGQTVGASSAVETQARYNVPPYVALLYCRKN